MKILVATPVYDGKLPVQTVSALLMEQAIAVGRGDELSFAFLPSCSNTAHGRNQLATAFIDSDAERLVFLDADVTFEPGALLKVAHYEQALVGGAYRFKHEPEEYPVGWLGGDLWANADGLLEVMTIPGGFMAISREVFERLKAAHPERLYRHMGREYHAYFALPFADGVMCGEDSYFCVDYRAIGGQVWLDPELSLTHWDFNRPYPGHIGQWLKRREAAKPLEATG